MFLNFPAGNWQIDWSEHGTDKQIYSIDSCPLVLADSRCWPGIPVEEN
jgi:hypothetical protein